MAIKNNIRSIRFSDELMEIINDQVGDVPRVKMALLKYPTVDSVEEVKSFMESVKGEDYYA